MKILLLGNYDNLRSQSMQRFAEMLRAGLAAAERSAHPWRPTSRGLDATLENQAVSLSLLATWDHLPEFPPQPVKSVSEKGAPFFSCALLLPDDCW